jgi:DNA integrity scanning protein DisA with diadenylate cyclase activity
MTIAALKALCSRISWCEPAVLESVLELGLEIAREGREGRRIGTLFTVGKADEVLAACRYLDASVEQIDLPLGFGSRHVAAASISQRLGAIAIVVSESGVVRVFHRGQIEATLIPELWLLDRHHTQLSVAAAGAVEAQRLGVTTLSVSEAGRDR